MKRLMLSFSLLMVSCVALSQQSEYTEPAILKADNENPSTGQFSDMEKAMVFLRSGLYKMSGFTNLGSGDIYYLLMGDVVGSFNLSTRQYLGGWPLTPFSDPDLEPEIAKLYEEFSITPEARTPDNLLPVLGCFPQHPLRYGDVTGDGNAELVVFTQDEFHALNMTIFSTQKHKTLLTVRLATYDAELNRRIELPDDVVSASYPLANNPQDGQYLSRIVEQRTRMVSGIRPAVINLSKVYFGSFSDEGTHDLLVWRKLYHSRLNQDPIKGFELQRDAVLHYKLVDGDYVKQATDSSQVKTWLSSNNLTWQKGYPSLSECPGQEGQLIPEMHDPLLNDPDVLQ